MPQRFDLQGHRGARGLKPENTLPSLEAALDAGVTSIEVDVHLSRDEVPILWHDPYLSDQFCRLEKKDDLPDPADRPPIHKLTLAQLRHYVADRNPEPLRFPTQKADVPPLSHLLSQEWKINPYALPRLADLIALVEAYAGDQGKEAGKTAEQRERARVVRLDIELKRVPYHDHQRRDPLEQRVVENLRQAGAVERASVRSFDHRAVQLVRKLEPRLASAVLIADTAPFDAVRLTRQAGATMYCPNYDFLDPDMIQQLHAERILIVPWTVNDPDVWEQLLDWGVDGITTDYPDRLAELLRKRKIDF
ncbi:MAG: glycerophosphodiester phosphodiesterase family protein [Gemmataceae bacterium]